MITQDDQKHLAELKAKMSGDGHQVYDSEDIRWLFGFVERLQADSKKMKDAMIHACEYWDGAADEASLWDAVTEIILILNEGLRVFDGIEYANQIEGGK